MSPGPSRLEAALADRYRLERELGAGGMATVYLAEDLKHDRKVAVKVLKPELAAVLGAERFVQEIKTTAALSHPHILPLFDSGEAAGFLYYVMPYLEGETIREKLNRDAQLGIDEAVKITTEVADALDYAHRHGVIHRDIKPENILLHDGRAMVMDFGIALAVSAAAGGRMTETGLSLGTPHYMSPEQATADRQITARSDIYSLASVLYEMLTGEPPHTGASAQQIIMKIVTDVVRPVIELRKSVPPHVSLALAQALAKLPADRFESAKAFADALGNPGFGAGSALGVTPASARPRTAGALAGWGVAALLAVALGWSLLARGRAPEPSTRFTLSLGNDASADIRVAISPDGRQIVQPGPDDRLLVRDLGSLEPRTLAGAQGTRPAISPDGRWIAYQNELEGVKKVPIEGGAPIRVGPCQYPTWVDADRLVCSAVGSWGLLEIGSDGGSVRQLSLPDTASGEIGLWSPDALPGGRAVIFTSYRRPVSRIEALDLETGRRSVVVENSYYAQYARSGHLLFMRDSSLFAVRFDPKTLTTEGSPVPVLGDIAAIPSNTDAGLAISANGTLVVVRQSQWWVDSRIVWADREGREIQAVTGPGSFFQPRLAPDGNRILVTVGRLSRNLWVVDQRRGALTQLTRNPGSAFYGIWTPDGREVLFTNETPSYDVYRIPADGSKPPSPVVSNTVDKYPYSISPDGKVLAVEEYRNYRGVTLVPLDGSGASLRVGDTTATLRAPQFSTNGRWLAVSGVLAGSAVSHIYLLRGDGTGGAVQVTGGKEGDRFPHWTRGGRELIFRRGTAVYAVDVDPATGQIGTERRLFDGDYAPDRDYDVTPDGNRFLMVKPVPRPEAQPLLVITNFFDELNRKVGR